MCSQSHSLITTATLSGGPGCSSINRPTSTEFHQLDYCKAHDLCSFYCLFDAVIGLWIIRWGPTDERSGSPDGCVAFPV